MIFASILKLIFSIYKQYLKLMMIVYVYVCLEDDYLFGRLD